MKVKDDNKLEQIYKATIALVGKEGLAGLTMQKLAKEAGIGTGTLYVYYKSKEELINDLFLKVCGHMTDNYLKGYNEQELFKPSFRIVFNNILNDKLSRYKDAVFAEQCQHSPFLCEQTKMLMMRAASPFFELLDRGKREHLLKNIDNFLLVTAVMGIVSEYVHKVSHGFFGGYTAKQRVVLYPLLGCY